MPPSQQSSGGSGRGKSDDRRTPALRYAQDYLDGSDEDDDEPDDGTIAVSSPGLIAFDGSNFHVDTS